MECLVLPAIKMLIVCWGYVIWCSKRLVTFTVQARLPFRVGIVVGRYSILRAINYSFPSRVSHVLSERVLFHRELWSVRSFSARDSSRCSNCWGCSSRSSTFGQVPDLDAMLVASELSSLFKPFNRPVGLVSCIYLTVWSCESFVDLVVPLLFSSFLAGMLGSIVTWELNRIECRDFSSG